MYLLLWGNASQQDRSSYDFNFKVSFVIVITEGAGISITHLSYYGNDHEIEFHKIESSFFQEIKSCVFQEIENINNALNGFDLMIVLVATKYFKRSKV
jgi:hypothetical protein